jgi:5'-3' exonuclease
MGKKPKKYGNFKNIRNTLLIDGNALFKLGFFGAKDMFTRDGDHIGGLYIFITILRKLLQEELYYRVFVFWDGKFSGRQRWELYSDYKCDRGKDFINGTHPIDIQEKTEIFLIRQYLEELCIRQLVDNSKAGVEADDFIAYYCKTKGVNERITICTSDRDLAQLINPDVRIYFCDRKIRDYVTLENYNNFFDHHQSNSKLIKIIGGDTSDSIKGIDGVKETTLLKYFPELKERPVHLSEIIQSAKKLQAERIKDKKKPLKALTNIIESNTQGVQGKNIYRVNKNIIDLSEPLINKKNKELVEYYRNPIGEIEDRGIKNVYEYMKRDGVDKEIESFSTNYLLPFKKLIERERKELNLINEQNEK